MNSFEIMYSTDSFIYAFDLFIIDSIPYSTDSFTYSTFIHMVNHLSTNCSLIHSIHSCIQIYALTHSLIHFKSCIQQIYSLMQNSITYSTHSCKYSIIHQELVWSVREIFNHWFNRLIHLFNWSLYQRILSHSTDSFLVIHSSFMSVIAFQ